MSEPSIIDVKSIRAELGWSQARLAMYLGCDQATVSRIENGGRITGPIQRLLEGLKAEAAA